MKIKTMFPEWISAVILLSLISLTASAQEEGPGQERIKAMKIAYITNEVELTPEEAVSFWPVYNEFEGSKYKIIESRKNITRNYMQNKETMSDKDVTKVLDDYIRLQKEETELSATFHEKFMKILPPKKVMNLYIAEMQFRHYLLEQLRGHKPEERGPGR